MSTTLSAIVTPVQHDLNLSYSQMGFILGTWQLVYTVAALPLGFLIDRIGTYKSLMVALIIIAMSAIFRPLAVDFWTLAVSVGIFGIGGSMVSIGIPKVVSIWFSGSERGTAAGIYSIGAVTGSIVALSLTNSVVIPLAGNWRNAYFIYSSISFLIFLVWLFWGRRSHGSGNLVVPALSFKDGGFLRLKETFSKNVLLVVIIGVTIFLVGHGLAQWLPTLLQLNGMTTNQAGFAVSMVNVFTIFGSLLATRLPYLIKSKRLAIGILVFVQGISVAAISMATDVTQWIALALIGLTGGFMPLLSLILMDLPEVGPAKMGVVGGVLFSIGEIGGFGGPALMGFLKEMTDSFSLGIIFLAVVCEAMIIPAFFLKLDGRTKKT